MTWGLLLLIATTLRSEVVLPSADAPPALLADFGILHQAKSRAGSHISATAVGRYEPTEVASDAPTFCDVRRIMPIRVPLCLRDSADVVMSLPLGNSACESLAAGLVLRSLSVIAPMPELLGGERSIDGRRCAPPSLKMWTVSEAEEMQSREEVVLKDMLKILDGIEPRRNWYSLSAFGMEKTRMIVPFSDAVASKVPVLLMVMHESGVLCAVTTLTASSFEALKRRTSPLVGGMCVPPGGACAGCGRVDGGAFCGRG